MGISFKNFFVRIIQYRKGVAVINHHDGGTTHISGIAVTFYFCLTYLLTFFCIFYVHYYNSQLKKKEKKIEQTEKSCSNVT